MKKIIIIAAPSGSGKTTLIRTLLANEKIKLMFSISATNRQARAGEEDGKSYYFLSSKQFKEKIEKKEFIEWEEVYANQYYGTLKTEIDRIWKLQSNIIFDLDVKGAINVKKAYPENSLSIFIRPPSIAELEKRLELRKSETAASIQKRIDRAELEISYADKFDKIIINDVLEVAIKEINELVESFLMRENK